MSNIYNKNKMFSVKNYDSKLLSKTLCYYTNITKYNINVCIYIYIFLEYFFRMQKLILKFKNIIKFLLPFNLLKFHY